MAIDPITLEVLRNRFDAIAEEVQGTLLRSSYSVILKEGEDCSAALFDAAGNIVAQSTALPQHMAAFMPAIRRILETFPARSMSDGDVFTMNDPHDGGTHLPDLVVAAPVLFEGALVAFSVCLAHQEDIGGKIAGSMPTDSTEIYQEGLILPPLKLYDAGRLNETLMQIIRRNVRIPHVVVGDISAEVAAVSVGKVRLLEVFQRYGRETTLAYMAELQDYAERLTRRAIAAIPDGVYRFTDYMDNDGIDLDRRVPICVEVTISGSEVTVDFAGTHPQVQGPINAPWSGGAGAAYYAIRCITDPALPNNQGCYRPIKVEIPKGSLLNPRHPAPVAIRAHTLKRAVDAVLGALVQAVPERVPAAPAGSISCVSFGGTDPATGEPFGLSDIVAGGSGGGPTTDGLEVVDTDVSNCMNIPAEAVETGYPLRVVSTRLRRDSAGAGRHRGGSGVERALRVIRGEVTASYRSERHFTQAWGLAGGRPGAAWSTEVRRADGRHEVIASKSAITLRPDDELVIVSGGGGGYGDPLDRDTQAVVDDVRDGRITAAAARELYGVVLDSTGRAPNVAATTALRDERRRPVTWLYDRGDGVTVCSRLEKGSVFGGAAEEIS